MKYIVLFLPLLVAGMIIDPNLSFNCDAQNALMFRKLKAFENNRAPLPHSATLSCDIEKKKREYSKSQQFEVHEKSLEMRAANPEKLDKTLDNTSGKSFNNTTHKTTDKPPVIPPLMMEICKKDEHVIMNAADLHSLQVSCNDITGNIRFNAYRDAIVDFGNLQTIGGSLYIENISNIVKIQGNRLQKIGGTFKLHSLTSLVVLDLPSLNNVKEIEWKVVPILNSANLNKEMKGLKKIVISDSSLSIINDFNKIREVDIFDINNNRFLEIIKANIETVRQKLSISANAKQLELEMPLLVSAQNITIRDTSSISLPKLESVGSSLELIENDFVTIDLSTLKEVGASLGIIDNVNLDLIDFANVSDIQGGLIIENNPKLQKIDAFKTLKQVGGGIYLDGKFSETNFPQLKLVKGSAYVKSDSDMFDCSRWTTPKYGRSFIRGGKVTCISGKSEESESIDTDGNVVGRNEKSDNSNKSGPSSNRGKHGLFSKVSHSGSAINEIPKIMVCTLAAVMAAAFII